MNLPCVLAMLYSCIPYAEPTDDDAFFLKDKLGQESPAGSVLINSLGSQDVAERETRMLQWFAAGYFPANLTRFKAIHVEGNGHRLTYWVMADYLSLGQDEDFVLTPMSWTAVKKLAASWQMLLPTAKMVDQIYQSATRVYWPHAYPPSDEMRSTAYFLEHNAWIGDRSEIGFVDHPLKAGHKKDLVVSPRLLLKPEKLAIYGWHNIGNGAAIQPLSLWRRKAPWMGRR